MPGRCPRGAIGDDDRILRVDQQSRRFGDRTGIALRRRRHREPRDPQTRRDLVRDRIFLQPAVDDQQHRHHRRRHRNLVGAHRRLGEVRQRDRLIVPLDVVAHHGRRVLHAVRPLDARPPQRRVERVAGQDVDRHAVAVGVVDRHRRVLHADRAVTQRRHRLALGLEVAVGHRHRRLFVQAGDELGRCVAAVVDDRLVDAAEARAGIGGDELEVQRLDHVDHEVAAGSVGRQDLDAAAGIDLAWRDRRAGLSGRAACCGSAAAACLAASAAALVAAALFRKSRRSTEWLL